jgi:hypothetical protein
MTKGEVVSTLYTGSGIEPGFTTLGDVANSDYSGGFHTLFLFLTYFKVQSVIYGILL